MKILIEFGILKLCYLNGKFISKIMYNNKINHNIFIMVMLIIFMMILYYILNLF